MSRERAGSHVLVLLIADRPGKAATHALGRHSLWRIRHRREPCTTGAGLWFQGGGACLSRDWGAFKSPSVPVWCALVNGALLPDNPSGTTGTVSLHWSPSLPLNLILPPLHSPLNPLLPFSPLAYWPSWTSITR